MTAPVFLANTPRRTWCDDDEPLVCSESGCQSDTEKAQSAMLACGADLDCIIEEPHRQNGSRTQDFGVLFPPRRMHANEHGDGTGASSGADGRPPLPERERTGGARGAGSGHPLPEDAVPPRTPASTRRGPGLAVGVHAGAAAGGGIGLSVGMGVGLLLDVTGLSLYVTDTKLPTHCGENMTRSDGVGATAGVGIQARLVVDGDAAAGDGRSAIFETPYGSVGMGISPDGSMSSVELSYRPSVGAAGHIDHVRTRYYPLLSHVMGAAKSLAPRRVPYGEFPATNLDPQRNPLFR